MAADAMGSSTPQQKYSATLFWNDVLRAFRSRMPVKTHRRHFKTYPDTFTGREAVDWLHGYLTARMHGNRVVNREQSVGLFRKFHEVGVFHQCGPRVKSDEFSTCALFRFSNLPISSVTRTPLACKNAQVRPTSGATFRQPVFDDVVVKNGADQSAAPRPPVGVREIGRDEFELAWKQCCIDSLRDFFGSDDLLSVFNSSKVHPAHVVYNATNFTNRGMAKVPTAVDDVAGWALKGMKCLANWPWLNGVVNATHYIGFERDVFNTLLDYFNCAAGNGAFLPPSFQQLFYAILDHAETLDRRFALMARNDVFTESNVNSNESDKMRNDNQSRDHQQGVGDLSDEFSECQRDADDANAAVTARFGELTFSQRTDMLNNLPGLIQSPKLLAQMQRISKPDTTQLLDMKLPPGKPFNPRASFSCTTHARMAENEETNNLGRPRLRSSIVLCPPQSHSVSAAAYGNRSMAPPPRVCSFQSLRVKQMTLDALSVALLMLPPKNRRWIQLLLRFIDRVSSNYCLKLDKFRSISNRALMINAFSGCFAPSKSLLMQNDGIRLLSCLLDLQAEIFNPPVDLEAKVKAKLRYAASVGSFCEQVSIDDYRRLTVESTAEAVVQLLDSIVNDDKMSNDEKTKQLKAFRRTYPLLYQRRFPDDPIPSKQDGFFDQLKEKLGFKQTWTM